MRQKNIFFNCVVDKKRLKGATAFFFRIYGESFVIEMLETLKKLGFHHATIAGSSIGIDDLLTPPSKAHLVLKAELDSDWAKIQESLGLVTQPEEFQHGTKLWQKVNDALKQKVVDYFCSTDLLNPVYMMAFSGARGNISQVRQLVGMRGLIADPKGDLIDFPIKSNFREGLTLTEYLISCFGARKGVVDTALRTATAGYLTRRLVDVSHHIVVLHPDCFTKHGIVLKPLFNNKKTVLTLYQRLVGRVLAETIKISDLSTFNQPKSSSIKSQKRKKSKLNINSKTRLNWGINRPISYQTAMFIVKGKEKVLVRSPLTCQTINSVCRLCYGWGLANGRLVNLGEAVGVIAGQSIGEPGTQLTMRTFHTGGIFYGQFFETVMQAPCSGKIELSSRMVGSLTRTVYGQLAFLIKEPTFIKICPPKGKPIKIAISKKNLLVVKEGQVVSTGQTIAEYATLTFSERAETKLVRVQRDGLISTSTPFVYYHQTKDSVGLLENPFHLLPGQVITAKTTNFIASSDVVGSNTLINLLRLVGRGVGFVAFAIHMRKMRKITNKEVRGRQPNAGLKSFGFEQTVTLSNRFKGPTNVPPVITLFKNEVVELKYTTPLLNIVFQRVEYHKFGYLFFANWHDSKTAVYVTPLEVVLRNSLTQNFFSYFHYAKTLPWFQILCTSLRFLKGGSLKWCDLVYFDNLLGWGDFLSLGEYWEEDNVGLVEKRDGQPARGLWPTGPEPMANRPKAYGQPTQGLWITPQSPRDWVDSYKVNTINQIAFFGKKQLLLNCNPKRDLITWQNQVLRSKKKQQKINNFGILTFSYKKRFNQQISKQGSCRSLNRTSTLVNYRFEQKKKDPYNHFFFNRQPVFLGYSQNLLISLQSFQQLKLCLINSSNSRDKKRVTISGPSFLKLYHPLFGRIVDRFIVCFSSPLPFSHQSFWGQGGFKLLENNKVLVAPKVLSLLPLWIATFWIDPSLYGNLNKKNQIYSLVSLISATDNKVFMSNQSPFVSKWRSFISNCLLVPYNKNIFIEPIRIAKKPFFWFKFTQKQNLSIFKRNSFQSLAFLNSKKIVTSKVGSFLSGYKQGWFFFATKKVCLLQNHRFFVRIGQPCLYPDSRYKQILKKETEMKQPVFANQHVVLNQLYKVKNGIEIYKNKKGDIRQTNLLLNVFFSKPTCDFNLHLFQFCFKSVKTSIFQKKSQFTFLNELVRKKSHISPFKIGISFSPKVFNFAQIGGTNNCRWHPFFEDREWSFSRIYIQNQSCSFNNNLSSCFWHFKKNKDFQESGYASQTTSMPFLILAQKVRPLPKRFFDCCRRETSKINLTNLSGSVKQQVSPLEQKVCNLYRSLSIKNLLFNEKFQDYRTLQKRFLFGGHLFSIQISKSTLHILPLITIDYIRLNDFFFQISEPPLSFIATVFVFTTCNQKETSIQMICQSRLAPYRSLSSNLFVPSTKKLKFRLTGRGIASFALTSLSNLPLILTTNKQSNSPIVQINSYNRTELTKSCFFPKGEIFVSGSPKTKKLIITQAEQAALTTNPVIKKVFPSQAEQTFLTKLKNISSPLLGNILRRGQIIDHNLAVATEGIVVQIENNLTVIHQTEGVPIGGPSNLKINGLKTIQTGDPMIDFKIERQKTEDIVQGIPKIEELFEGRSEAEVLFLNFELNSISQQDQQHYPDLKSLKRSYRRIQIMVVESIQRIYISQGVSISDKHVEIVVKQMTLAVSMFNRNNPFGNLFPITVSLSQFSKSFFLGLGMKRHIVRQWFRGKAVTRLAFSVKKIQKGNYYISRTTISWQGWRSEMKKINSLKKNNRRLCYRLDQRYQRPTCSFSPLKKLVFKSGNFSFIRLWESVDANGTFLSLQPNRKILDECKKIVNQKRSLKPWSIKWVCAPLLMGITKSALCNTSFLAAASFQQTILVLTHSASVGRLDFLRGIKERGAIGEQIKSGTGQVGNFLIKKRVLYKLKSDSNKMIYDWVLLYLKNEKAAFFFKENIINSLKFLTVLEPLKYLVSSNNSNSILHF